MNCIRKGVSVRYARNPMMKIAKMTSLLVMIANAGFMLLVMELLRKNYRRLMKKTKNITVQSVELNQKKIRNDSVFILILIKKTKVMGYIFYIIY